MKIGWAEGHFELGTVFIYKVRVHPGSMLPVLLISTQRLYEKKNSEKETSFFIRIPPCPIKITFAKPLPTRTHHETPSSPLKGPQTTQSPPPVTHLLGGACGTQDGGM